MYRESRAAGKARGGTNSGRGTTPNVENR